MLLLLQFVWPSSHAKKPEAVDARAEKLVKKTTTSSRAESITIPGTPTINVSTKTNMAQVGWENPVKNPCYFKYRLILAESGETLFQSQLIKPGLGFNEIHLSKSLPKGKHQAIIVIETTSLATGKPLNGAKLNSVLNVV
ncbi:hypothetical protein EQG49_04105 [Periweissella cryptocerci]|uniref:Uncharacterized protein n=1 Tax=Periweissella cryptocerci TaxID=2506420 RepID=A0A4P6YSR7_9LACO|nr:hypothetical protein [Periweissella cryptocerci]QBO35700.1 hypothetical protein EQG49_04105 [Periweissella cryptocerci]